MKEPSELAGICPEYTKGMLAPCASGDTILACRDRNRNALAFAAIKRILTRTPEEQATIWGYSKSADRGEAMIARGHPLLDTVKLDESIKGGL